MNARGGSRYFDIFCEYLVYAIVLRFLFYEWIPVNSFIAFKNEFYHLIEQLAFDGKFNGRIEIM